MNSAEQNLLLSGRYFTPEEIRQVQETLRVFSALSRSVLLQTICEHPDWVTPTGRYKVAVLDSSLNVSSDGH